MPYTEKYPRLAYMVVRDANQRTYYAEIWERPSGKEMHVTDSVDNWQQACDEALSWIAENHARIEAAIRVPAGWDHV